MDQLQPSLVASPLPSCSPLMGTIRPATADAAVESTLQRMNKPANRRWVYGVPQEVGSLKAMASQHVASLGKAPGTPYRKTMTPEQTAELEGRRLQGKHLVQTLMQGLIGTGKTAENTGESSTSPRSAPTSPGAQRAGDVDGKPAKPMTPAQIMRVIKELTPSRPGTSMSVQDVNFSIPSAAARRATPMSSSWSGPLPSLLPSSAPAPDTAGPAGATSPSHSLPCSPCGSPRKGSRFAKRRAGLPLPPSGGLPGPWDPHFTRGGTTGEQPVVERLVLPPAPASRGGGGEEAQGGQQGQGQRATACPSPQELRELAVSATTANTLRPKWGPGESLHHFVPSRGLMYSVFSELDDADTGKLSYSQFEGACVLCGLKPDQTTRLFKMLDRQERGYITIQDWGAADFDKQVADFTRLYIQSTRGASGKPMGVREIKSTSLAVQIALHRLQIKNHGRVVSQDKLMRAFEFLDSDGSGALSLAELSDGFNGMGIYVSPEVLVDIVTRFDTNHNGVIEYREFLGALYPVLSKAF